VDCWATTSPDQRGGPPSRPTGRPQILEVARWELKLLVRVRRCARHPDPNPARARFHAERPTAAIERVSPPGPSILRTERRPCRCRPLQGGWMPVADRRGQPPKPDHPGERAPRPQRRAPRDRTRFHPTRRLPASNASTGGSRSARREPSTRQRGGASLEEHRAMATTICRRGLRFGFPPCHAVSVAYSCVTMGESFMGQRPEDALISMERPVPSRRSPTVRSRDSAPPARREAPFPGDLCSNLLNSPLPGAQCACQRRVRPRMVQQRPHQRAGPARSTACADHRDAGGRCTVVFVRPHVISITVLPISSKPPVSTPASARRMNAGNPPSRARRRRSQTTS